MNDEKQEEIAEVIADYRHDVEEMEAGRLHLPTTGYLTILLDRIEAALSAEAWRSLHTPGNAADIRAALVAIRDAARNFCHQILNSKYNDIMDEYKCRERGFPALLDLRYTAIPKANAALAAPPRNCDVGTAEEQFERYLNFCRRHEYSCGCTQCPANKTRMRGTSNCDLAWAQMPYEGGGAK